jgi:hypothetical protein
MTENYLTLLEDGKDGKRFIGNSGHAICSSFAFVL